MAKYYYLSKILNNGTDAEPEYDVKINQDSGLAIKPVIKINPATSKPYQLFALCVAQGEDHRSALADDDNFVLGKGYPPIAKFSALNQATQNDIKNKMVSIGVGVSGLLGTDVWQAYVEKIGTACDPNFDFDNFDISG